MTRWIIVASPLLAARSLYSFLRPLPAGAGVPHEGVSWAASMGGDEVRLYRWMVMSRVLGTALCALNVRWFPAQGEEATLVGSFCDLRRDDAAAPHYRDPFVVYLMPGG